MEEFQTVALLFGLLLVVGALVSGLAGRSFLSLTALFVLVGFALGDGGLQVISFAAHDAFVEQLAIIALIVILFRDGLEVDGEMLQKAWHWPARKLILVMPLTALAIAGFAHLVIGLGQTEALLLGALLSPTDPILASAVVTNHRVPRLVRHSLNLESGLNDGLALPFVLVFSASLLASDGFVWWQFLLQDIGFGVLAGLAIGYASAWLMPRDHFRLPDHAKSLYALGIAFVAYGAAVALPHGNGLIAVFVAAVVLGLRRADIRIVFEDRSSDIIEIVKLGIFVVFGALLSFEHLSTEGGLAIALAAFIFFIARPAAVFVGLIGTGEDLQTKLFMGWFGPRGISTMAFSLLVLSMHTPGAEQLFSLCAAVVFFSILLHGSTDTLGARWLAAHAARKERSG